MNELTLAPTQANGFSLVPRTFEEALKFAEIMASSDLVPSGYKSKPGNILVAIQKGAEVGLSPMASLETIAVINGRASMYGDGPLALVQAHPAYEWIDESQSTDMAGVCTVKRRGETPYTQTFTLEDAKRAGLLGKAGPWTQYTKRMLQMRARGFALRDKFADALKGIIQAEEALDITPSDNILAAQVETPQSAPTLKDKLKAQITETPAQAEQAPTASPQDVPPAPQPAPPVPPHAHAADVCGGYILALQKAKTKAVANGILIEAKNNPDLNADQFTMIQDAYAEQFGGR